MVRGLRKNAALILGSVALAAAALSAAPARAEHTRVTNPNALSLEMFGRGLLYNVQFDRVFSDDLVAGIGYGSVGTKTTAGVDTSTSANLVPVYVNLYLLRNEASPFVTAGATLVANSSDVKGLKSKLGNLEFDSGVIPTFGAGYEVRTDANLLFRVTGYGELGKSLVPWFGFTLGYAF